MNRKRLPTSPDYGHIMESADEATEFLKLLSNSTRLSILCVLYEMPGGANVREIEEKLRLRQPNLSQQLGRLRDHGLVTTKRAGKMVYYSLASSETREMIELLHHLFCEEGEANNCRADTALGKQMLSSFEGANIYPFRSK